MNYERIYYNLIQKTVIREEAPAYCERHHIIPRCMGGDDDICNITLMSPEEHFVAHQLLCKMHPGNSKLMFAAYGMTAGYKRNNKKYGWLKRKFSENQTGDKNPLRRDPSFLAKMIENRRKVVPANVGKYERTPEIKAKCSAAAKLNGNSKRISELNKSRVGAPLPKWHAEKVKSGAAKRGYKHPPEIIELIRQKAIDRHKRKKNEPRY